MDLGIRILLAGWRTRYIATSWVSQQAVPDFGRLLRQRTRWFQGALQCLRYLPAVVSSDCLPLKTRVDLAGTLLAPLSLITLSPVILIAWGQVLVGLRLRVPDHNASAVALFYVTFYVLACLPALLLGFVFWLDDPDSTLPRAILAGHAFLFYSYLWTLAGWRALTRQVLRRDNWIKTPRVDETIAVAPRS
jgi:cellulose synthase/poly-beta-1,6-N-acetylglucosamine synthase-like glycosyltransferase